MRTLGFQPAESRTLNGPAVDFRQDSDRPEPDNVAVLKKSWT